MEDYKWSHWSSVNSGKCFADEIISKPLTFLKENNAIEEKSCYFDNSSYPPSHDMTTDDNSHYYRQNSQEQYDFEGVVDYDNVSQFLNIDEKMSCEEGSPPNPSNRLLAPDEISEDDALWSQTSVALEDYLQQNQVTLEDPFQQDQICQPHQDAHHTVERSEHIPQVQNNVPRTRMEDSDRDDIETMPSKKVCNNEGQEWSTASSKNVSPSEKQPGSLYNYMGDNIDMSLYNFAPLFQGIIGKTPVSVVGKKEVVEPKKSKTSKKRKIETPKSEKKKVSDKRPERNYLKLFVSGMQKMIVKGKIGAFLDDWAHSGIVTKQDVLKSLKESAKVATSYSAFKASVFVDQETRDSILPGDIVKLAKLKLAKEFIMKENYEWWVYNAFATFTFDCNHKPYEENEKEKQAKRERFLQKRDLLCKQFLSCFKDPDVEFDI